MENNIAFLFVYGTLLNESNEFALYLHQHSSFYSKGRFEGLMYDLGHYPGAIYSARCGGFVEGVIFKLGALEPSLKVLDNYEGFGDEHLQPNEFIRELIAVTTEDGMITCWVYLYNHPIAGLQQIIGGDYLKR